MRTSVAFILVLWLAGCGLLPDQIDPRAQLVLGKPRYLSMVAGVEQDWAVKKGAVWWLRWRQRDGEPEVTLHAVQGPDAL